MFDLAWSHILLIAVVALLVIGPKDLPRVLRTAGKWVGRARSIARDFQGSLDQMIREAELEEVRNEVEKAATIDLDHTIESTVDPGGELKQNFAEPPIEASQGAIETTVPPPEIVPDAPAVPPAATPSPTTAHPAEPAETHLAEPAETHRAEPPAEAAKSGTHD
jgi:sec-independent protein translocase protein TatB